MRIAHAVFPEPGLSCPCFCVSAAPDCLWLGMGGGKKHLRMLERAAFGEKGDILMGQMFSKEAGGCFFVLLFLFFKEPSTFVKSAQLVVSLGW